MSGGETAEIDGTTHFVFEHKVFSMAGSYFAAPESLERPVFYMPMGETVAGVPLQALRDEFGIELDSDDGRLLQTVADGLKFVKVIRTNDAIPRELLDGSASWSVDEQHRLIAQAKLTMVLVNWLTGSQAEATNLAEFQKLLADPETQARLQDAFAAIAEKLGFGRENKQQVVGLIDQFGHEMSFIEGLRDHFKQIAGIGGKISRLFKVYPDDLVHEDLMRVRALLRPVIKATKERFEALDAKNSKIIPLLRTFDDHVRLIRTCRDDLHRGFRLWDEQIEAWRDEPAVERSEELELLIKETYRFLAQHFLQSQDWTLTNRP